MARLLAIAVIASALLLGACGDDDRTTTEPAAGARSARDARRAIHRPPTPAAARRPATRPRSPQPKPGTEITVGSSQFGEIVFDAKNQAIYLFDAETTSEPECYGDCAAAWPPVLTEGEPVASGAAKQKLLGTTKRDDGSTQVTYAGQPLYYYAHEGPGQVLCHNVSEFGGLWLVLDANGDALS